MADFAQYCVELLDNTRVLTTKLALSNPKSAHEKLLASQSKDFSIDFGKGGCSRIDILQERI